LLLHDTGDSLSSDGAYASQRLHVAADPRSPADASFPSRRDAFAGRAPRPTPASRREWRTPPLWGVRDSGPYLHDGRAETLEQAIALHHGEASSSGTLSFELQRSEREAVLAFLKSLGTSTNSNLVERPKQASESGAFLSGNGAP